MTPAATARTRSDPRRPGAVDEAPQSDLVSGDRRRNRCLPAVVTARAVGGGGGSSGTGPGPSSQGGAALTHGKLVAGAGGTYLPVPPSDIVPTGTDPRNPLEVPPQGPNPQGLSCPTTRLFHVGPGSPAPGGGVVAVISIHPAFARNTTGGYDGYDGRYGYSLKSAIPSGGDPAAVAPGSLCHRRERRRAHRRGDGVSEHPRDLGGCPARRAVRWKLHRRDVHVQSPVSGGKRPATGATDVRAPDTSLSHGTRSGRRARRGMDDRRRRHTSWARSNCTNLRAHPDVRLDDFDVPSQVTPFHALTATVADGYTLFLLYEVTITPGAVTWNWGDGTSTTKAGPVEHGPTACRTTTPLRRRGPIRAR